MKLRFTVHGVRYADLLHFARTHLIDFTAGSAPQRAFVDELPDDVLGDCMTARPISYSPSGLVAVAWSADVEIRLP